MCYVKFYIVNITFIVFFLTLFLAISAIFVIEYFDDTIKNVEDAEKILGIKVIAIIPSLHLE
jgi:capsular polysaccharide biosynthesis protein